MDNEEVIDIRELLQIIKKKLHIVVIVTLLATTIMAAVSYFVISPIYQTKLSVFIGDTFADNDRAQMDSVNLYQKLMKTYVEIAKSNLVGEKTVEKLKLNISPEALQDGITVTPKQDTQLLIITVKGKDPAEALRIIKGFGETFIEEGKRMYPNGDIKIMDNAKLPTSPISPNIKLNIMLAFMGGLVASIFLILLLNILDRTIKTEEDVERYLELPVIGLILKQLDTLSQSKLIAADKPKSVISEAFRTLRTNIEFSSFDKKIKTIMVTSANPGEGKSTTTSNLAVVMAQSGKKTLLIDCDQRKPNLHKIFNLVNQQGLSNLLAGAALLEDVVYKTEINNLFIITSGVKPPNPAELLSSEKMKQFVEVVSKNFDYIIIDTPPVGLVTDAQILSQYADGCLLVVSSSETDREVTIKAKELLKKVNAKILGVVLNKFDVKNFAYYSKDNYYYAYYGDDKVKSKKKKRKISA